MKFHAKTVAQCWQIARQQTEAYQRMAHHSRNSYRRAACLAKRDAADRIAMTIRHGRGRKRR